MKTLMVIAVDGNDLVALTPVARVELARVHVKRESTISHVNAAYRLIEQAFYDLEAQGYPRAGSR